MQERRRFRRRLILLVALAAADVALTAWILEHHAPTDAAPVPGGFAVQSPRWRTESNPLADRIYLRFGVAGLAAWKAVVLSGVVAIVRITRKGWVLTVANAITGAVVVYSAAIVGILAYAAIRNGGPARPQEVWMTREHVLAHPERFGRPEPVEDPEPPGPPVRAAEPDRALARPLPPPRVTD